MKPPNAALAPMQSEVLFNVLDAMHDGVMVVDASGVIIYANPAYTRIFGVVVSMVLGRRLADIEPDSRVLKVLETGQPVVDDPSFVLSAGVDIVADITPILEDRQLTGVVAVFRDRREILSMQEKLKLVIEEVKKSRLLSDRYYSELQQLRARFLDVDDMVFESRPMRTILSMVIRLADVDSTVMISGESGVGKDIIAALIHRTSLRSGEAFVTLNCGAIPENLLESELFGYEKGSFTGAGRKGKIGLLEAGHRGTVFLDEIGDLPLALQVKLLWVIQEQKILRIGGLKPITLDVRFLAASNRDLQAMVGKQTFREDLYYRLNVVPIHIPPLRERPRDIIPLTRFFLARFNERYHLTKKIAPEVLRSFESYGWPGNVRELENLVERLVVCSDREVITLEDEALARSAKTTVPSFLVSGVMPLKEARARMEKDLVSRALTLGGTSRGAARLLAVDHATVLRKVRQYGLPLVE
ncbi:MAG: sigma 54-interacting transcriptional regulator [Peptococcaceae bacterium]|nr:sigma 54-interacting transcriptional regulator [Peptococcaceae bacterium]